MVVGYVCCQAAIVLTHPPRLDGTEGFTGAVELHSDIFRGNFRKPWSKVDPIRVGGPNIPTF